MGLLRVPGLHLAPPRYLVRAPIVCAPMPWRREGLALVLSFHRLARLEMSSSNQIGHSVSIAGHGGHVVRQSLTGDALVWSAVVGVVDSDVGHPGLLPSQELAAP